MINITKLIQDAEFTIEQMKEALTANSEDIKNYLLKTGLTDEYSTVISFDGRYLELEDPNDKMRKTFDFENSEHFLNLGFEEIIDLAKMLGITPMAITADLEEMESRMTVMMKDVLSPIVNFKTQTFKITDNTDGYYIGAWMDTSEYTPRKDYLDEKLISFKCFAGNYIVFELNSCPKAALNMTGSPFYRTDRNSDELLRGILISHYYFGNAELLD